MSERLTIEPFEIDVDDATLHDLRTRLGNTRFPAQLPDAGVRAVVEPGGSVRDDEVVAAAKDAGITLYFTGTRHFFH